MSLEIKTVSCRKDLKAFIEFPEKLYRDNNCYVPTLFADDMETLNPKKSPSSSFCDSELFLAYRDGELVGRVAAIVNFKANSQWNHQEVRFGWFDFVDDKEVSAALIDKVVDYGRAHGMESVVGPLGFTDFDPEGMLVDGYDCLGTLALIYNHPYYKEHIESLGFRKEADWIEFKVTIPEVLPDRIARVSKVICEKNKVHLRPLTKKIIHKENYGRKVFNLINECYKNLYNFTVLPDDMADKYFGLYLNLLDPKYLSMVENDNGELVAFGITMPSLARALQKCRGKLLPFGWFHLLKAIYSRKNEGIEMLLVGVRPDYQNSGINSLLFSDLFSKMSAIGKKWAETNAVLETNLKNQGQWKDFDCEVKKRRRSYIRAI